MKTLNELIKEHGKPDAIIDHWDKSSNRYAIWGFEDIYSINHYDESINPFQEWQEKINLWKMETKENGISAIGFFSYDFKKFIFPHHQYKSCLDSTPLVWFGKPKKLFNFKLEKTKNNNVHKCLELIKDIPDLDHYISCISYIKNQLRYGNIYQINFTNPKKFKIRNDNNLDLYMMIRNIAKPPFGFYINIGSHEILSLSPERFFKKTNNIISTHPIKGTRPRSNNYTIDNNLKKSLEKSIKDKAEHLMIVDLMRNDLGKICKYGSIKTHNLYKIKSFETVHHMITDIYGTLKEQIDESKIIKSLFPGGSITGAPKENAMKIIDKIENYNRGVYTGSMGYINKIGDMDFNIAIRTLEIKDENVSYPVGGGIVWDSTPKQEWDEANQKAKILDKLIK